MLFFELLKAIFLGVVEGITEWLPVSSTGHLILVQEFIKLNQDKAFLDMFNIVIQLGVYHRPRPGHARNPGLEVERWKRYLTRAG